MGQPYHISSTISSIPQMDSGEIVELYQYQKIYHGVLGWSIREKCLGDLIKASGRARRDRGLRAEA